MDYFWEYNSVWKSEWKSLAWRPISSSSGLSGHRCDFGHKIFFGFGLGFRHGRTREPRKILQCITDQTLSAFCSEPVPGYGDCPNYPRFHSVFDLEYFGSWRKSLDLNKIHMFPVSKACRLQKRNGRTVIFWFRTCHQIKR